MQGPPGGPAKVKECCKVSEIIPQDILDKCEAANPKPAGPPRGKIIRIFLNQQNQQKFSRMLHVGVRFK